MSREITGILELAGEARGFIRDPKTNYRIKPSDPIVPRGLCQKTGLRGGETIAGTVREGGRNGRSSAPEVAEIHLVNNRPVEERLEMKPFEELTAIDPDQAVRFETAGGPMSMRVVDLLTPIGLGQRGLIVAAPRTGKTILLQQMANGIAANHPNVHVMILLVDERPEEVTDMRRNVQGEVIASCNDQNASNHIRISRLVIEKAKRMVECGDDVLILLDSLTRLGRAFNVGIRGGGRIMSGGLDIRALTEPKAIFGAARNVENGGSLTIIASSLIETGSRMDDVIFNEFKGTGNMEIMLSRQLANRRIWPAIDLEQSGTRKEERLLTPEALAASYHIRRSLGGRGAERSMEQLLEVMGRFPDNAGFVRGLSERAIR